MVVFCIREEYIIWYQEILYFGVICQVATYDFNGVQSQGFSFFELCIFISIHILLNRVISLWICLPVNALTVSSHGPHAFCQILFSRSNRLNWCF